MYFLVNASPPKLLDVATSNFADALVRSKAGIWDDVPSIIFILFQLQIQFRSCYGQKLKSELCQFDGRFSLMLKSPLIEDPHKFLRTKQEPYSHLLDPLPPSGKPKGKGIYSYCKVNIMNLILYYFS